MDLVTFSGLLFGFTAILFAVWSFFNKDKHTSKIYYMIWIFVLLMELLFLFKVCFNPFNIKADKPEIAIIDLDSLNQIDEDTLPILTFPQIIGKDTESIVGLKTTPLALSQSPPNVLPKTVNQLFHIHLKEFYKFEDIKGVVTSDNEILIPRKGSSKDYFNILAPDKYYGKAIIIEYVNSEELYYDTLK